MRSGSLFSGYGGLDIAAAAVLGCDTAWFCDIDPGASRILAHHWPDVPNLGNITAVDWSAVEPVDVLTGGFPCQDISNAGRRAGIEGARSGLWSFYADAIRVLRPRYVLIENVGALIVRGLDRVLADLASLGFDAEWTTVRASDVGAPHRRERVFIAAHANHFGHQWSREARNRRIGSANDGVPVAYADGDRLRQQPESVTRGSGSPIAGQPGRISWGPYEPAIRRWEHTLGRPAPAPTVVGSRGGRVLNPEFPEWMMGLPSGHVTQVPGLSRNEQLRAIGNGVCPQQGAAAFSLLLDRLHEVAA